MTCTEYWFGICFVPVEATESVFGFGEFISALALLVIVYTVTDVRYRFRLAIAPLKLFRLTYLLIAVIGFGILLTDIWSAQGWLVPATVISLPVWDGMFAALFLVLVMSWMYHAFIHPPIFGRRNYKQYGQTLYQFILKGSDAELPIIAHELAQSVKPLVRLAGDLPRVANQGKQKPHAEGYAHDILLMIANRKFCRHVAASSPVTAIRFLQELSDTRKFYIPLGLFVRNVSTEAIVNTDSLLYHEDEPYESGLLGRIKPFSQAFYGDYELVEGLGGHSPLDIHYEIAWSWNAKQFETYCRAVTMTWESYLKSGHWYEHSFTLFRAFGEIKEATGRAISEIDAAPDKYVGEPHARLRTGVRFLERAIELVSEQKELLRPITLRLRTKAERRPRETFYDHIANAMFDVIHHAAFISGPPQFAWSIHHNAVWSHFFEHPQESQAWKIVRFKLRRRLYDEIQRMEELPNYQGARILGICLSVMGIKRGRPPGGYAREHYALKRAVLNWTERNYLRLREVNPDIADACLIGGITYDAENKRLVRTYLKGLSREIPRDYLPLKDPPPSDSDPAGEPAEIVGR